MKMTSIQTVSGGKKINLLVTLLLVMLASTFSNAQICAPIIKINNVQDGVFNPLSGLKVIKFSSVNENDINDIIHVEIRINEDEGQIFYEFQSNGTIGYNFIATKPYAIRAYIVNGTSTSTLSVVCINSSTCTNGPSNAVSVGNCSNQDPGEGVCLTPNTTLSITGDRCDDDATITYDDTNQPNGVDWVWYHRNMTTDVETRLGASSSYNVTKSDAQSGFYKLYAEDTRNNCQSTEYLTLFVPFYYDLEARSISSPVAIPSPAIPYDSNPGLITGENHYGGDPNSYSYQWYASTSSDQGTLASSPIPGATAKNYTPSSLTAPTSFMRGVSSCGLELFSNIITINVLPCEYGVTTGTISNAVSTPVCAGTNIGQISGTPINANHSNYSYQWEVASGETGAFQPIADATDQNYTPSSLTSSVSYRRKDILCNLTIYPSNILHFEVYDDITPGTISSTVSTPVCAGTNIGQITGTAIESEVANYSYQWYVSYGNNTSYNPIPEATGKNHTPSSGLNTSTYFKRLDALCELTQETNELYFEVYTIDAPTLTNERYNTCVGNELLVQVSDNLSSNYEWTKNGNILPSTSDNASLLSTSILDKYTVMGIQPDGCRTNVLAIDITIYQHCDFNINRITTIQHQVSGITVEKTSFEGTSISDYQQTKNYFDGFGRPVQTVVKMASHNQSDLVSPIVYDEYGRQSKGYLPYVSSENNGRYKANTVDTDGNEQYEGSPHSDFYQNAAKVAVDTKPFSETIFDNSPLNRVNQQYGPGEKWSAAGDDKPISFTYKTNTFDEVRLWKISGAFPIPSMYYTPGELYKNVTIDEESHQVIEFTDKQERTILKRVQAVDNPSVTYVTTDWADTYYVYDDFGNLRFVLPPEAVNNLDQYNNQ